MPKFHNFQHGAVTINVKDCLQFIVQNVDPAKVVQFRVIRDNWPLIIKLAGSPVEVDLMNDDHTSWGGHDFAPLQESIERHICPHSHTTHHTELMVQMIGNIRCNGGSKTRISTKGINHSFIGLQHNLAAKKVAKEKKPRI